MSLPPPLSTLFPYTTLFRSDLSELLVRHRIDWTMLLKRAADADSERMFLLGLHLAERLLDAPLPPHVKERCHSDLRLRSEEHTSELQSQFHLVCRLLLEKKK